MLRVGNAPLSWGVFEGDAETNPAWSSVLDEIVEAGYRRTELGPIGFLPEDADALRAELGRRELELGAGFVYEHMHDPAQREVVMRNTRRVGRLLSALGARHLVVIDRMVPERQRTAGRSERAERLSPEAWSEMIATIDAVARLAADEFGLRPVLHPHCGTHIEFADEIERALAELPHATIGLCVDTGHSAVAGLSAAELTDRYGERVEYLHIKDVDPVGLQRMLDEDLEFDEALGVGLFCPIGQGIVDFAGLRAALERIGFSGSATVEQDPDPRVDLSDYSGLAAARESLSFLRDVGLAANDGADREAVR
ncbi:MAG TPA: sugar phosphate isomerase/epimerase [Conexibacter sp.]